MGHRTVKWNKSAVKRSREIGEWYFRELGFVAGHKYMQSVKKAEEQIAAMPSIGQKCGREGYRTIVVHPRVKMLYRYTRSTVVIVALYSTRMNYII